MGSVHASFWIVGCECVWFRAPPICAIHIWAIRPFLTLVIFATFIILAVPDNVFFFAEIRHRPILIDSRNLFLFVRFPEIWRPISASGSWRHPQISCIYTFLTFVSPTSIVCLPPPHRATGLLCYDFTQSHYWLSRACLLVSPSSFCSINFLYCWLIDVFKDLL